MLLEQFFRALPRDMAIRVREEKPKSVREASELADNYELARKAGPGGGVARTPLEEINPAVPSDKSGPPSSAASRGVDVQRSKTNFRGEIQCWECKKYDHMAIACPDRQSAGGKAASKPVMVATQDLRINKTRGRILKCYYWPGVFWQVADYCKTCGVCQKGKRLLTGRHDLHATY